MLNDKNSAAKPDLLAFLKEVEYWIDFSPAGGESGKWLSKEKGTGLDFEEIVSFLAFPVIQQIDLLSTLRSLSPIPLVKIYKEVGRINLVILADVSHSMVFGSAEPKTWVMAKLSTLFGYTAYRYGDKFGFYGCDAEPIEELLFPPMRSKIYGLEIGEKLLDFQPTKNSGRGLLSAIELLPKKRSLVLLVSDFRLPAEFTEELLSELSLKHQVVPMVIWDEREIHWPKKFLGLVNLREIESSAHETILFSRKTAQSFGLKSQREKRELENIFQKYNLLPVYLSAVDQEKIEKISQEMERGRR